MLLKKLPVTAIVLLLLAGCQNESVPYIGDGWGNTAGNIAEVGYIARGDDGYVFFLDDDETGPGLYHMNEAGEISLLRKCLAYQINVVGDQVYFVNGMPGPICSISTDGKDFKIINNKEVLKLCVNASCMVYKYKSKLYIADSNGKSPKILAENVLEFVTHNDTIVFVQYHTDQDGIYQIGLDGSNLTCLSNDVPESLTSNGKSIYYSVYTKESQYQPENAKVYQIDENGETAQLPIEDRIWNMNATDDYIFYRNQTEKGDLCRMNLDGSDQVRLLEGNCSNINVVGDTVLFRDIGSGLCTIRNDGSGYKSWTGDIESIFQ